MNEDVSPALKMVVFHCHVSLPRGYPFSHYHGSVENHPAWKETDIGDTPVFHWTMIMRGRVLSENETAGKGTNIEPNHPFFFISTCWFSGKWNNTRVPQYEHLIGTVELKFNKVTESYYGTHLQTHFRRKSSSSFQKQTLRNDFIDIYWIFPLNSHFASP